MSVNIILNNAIGWGMIPIASEQEFYNVWIPMARKHNFKFISDVADIGGYDFNYEELLKMLEYFKMFRHQLESKNITSGNYVKDDQLIHRLKEIIDGLEKQRGNEIVKGSIG